jgi:hypothetical protein
VLRKGGKVATMPLAPRVARALDLATGERLDGPIFIEPDGKRLDRHAASTATSDRRHADWTLASSAPPEYRTCIPTDAKHSADVPDRHGRGSRGKHH